MIVRPSASFTLLINQTHEGGTITSGSSALRFPLPWASHLLHARKQFLFLENFSLDNPSTAQAPTYPRFPQPRRPFSASGSLPPMRYSLPWVLGNMDKNRRKRWFFQNFWNFISRLSPPWKAATGFSDDQPRLARRAALCVSWLAARTPPPGLHLWGLRGVSFNVTMSAAALTLTPSPPCNRWRHAKQN